MTFCGKVHDVVELIVCKQLVDEATVANVPFYEIAAFIVDVIGNCSQISCVGQCIQNNHPNVIVIGQNIFHVVRTDKAGGPCH